MRRAVAGHPFTKSGIEIALWDILGKAAGLPVYRLLGGAVRETSPDQRCRCPAPNPNEPLNWPPGP